MALASSFAVGCDDSSVPDPPEDANIYVIAALDPDFSNLADVQPGRLVWFSTRAGRARFLSGSREVADQAAVSGGEVCSTTILPTNLDRGVNTIDIRLVLQRGGGEIAEQAQLYVTAECTWHDHCDGSCVNYQCQ
jgi:hypothetical protein